MMEARKRYRISRWSIFALLVLPFAVVVSVITVAALEQPQPTEVSGQGGELHRLMTEVVRKFVAVPAKD